MASAGKPVRRLESLLGQWHTVQNRNEEWYSIVKRGEIYQKEYQEQAHARCGGKGTGSVVAAPRDHISLPSLTTKLVLLCKLRWVVCFTRLPAVTQSAFSLLHAKNCTREITMTTPETVRAARNSVESLEITELSTQKFWDKCITQAILIYCNVCKDPLAAKLIFKSGYECD